MHTRTTAFDRFGLGLLLLFVLGVAGAAQAGDAEGPIVKEIKVVGGISVSPDFIKAKMGTRVGKPLNDRLLDEDFQRLNRLEMVADAQFKKEDVDDGVRLLVLIREKEVIRRIQFIGNKEISKEKLEEDVIQVKVGDRYDPGIANRDARAIEEKYREEYYYFVTVEPRVEPFEDGVRLVYDISEGGHLYVEKVVFRGNDSFTSKELRKYMETRPSTWFTRGKYDRLAYEKDLERLRLFYQSKGFLDIRITERPFEIVKGRAGWRNAERSEATIFIDIEEGEQYRVGRVDFEGNDLVNSDDLRAVVETMPGDIFNPIVAQEDASKIRDIYGKYPSSRYFTKVQADRQYTEEGPIVDVVFRVKEGKEVIVEDVQIIGLTKTQDRVIRREIEQLPGEKIDSEKIRWSKINLHNLGYFKNMNFEVKPGSDPETRAKVVVDVEEGPTGRLQLGAGVSSRESFVGTIQLEQRNFDAHNFPSDWKDFFLGKAFAGGGQRANINLSAGTQSQRYQFDFREPWFYGKPISFGFGMFYKNWEWSDYDEQRIGGYLSLGKRLFDNRHLNASATYKIERVALREFESDVAPSLKAEEGTNWISRMIFNVTYDSRDSRFDPKDGLMIRGTQEWAGSILGGSKDFWRSFAEVNYFHQFFKDKQERPWVLGLRADFSAGDAYGDTVDMPLYERFYGGGIGSIRGFRYRSISPRDSYGDETGGEVMNAYSAEFFVPVYEKLIRMSAFYDVGAVWNWSGEDDLSDDRWRSSTGIGLHVMTPLSPAPIRLYWTHAIDEAKNDETETFQFTFGAFF